jgi:hypothetical protein
MIGNIYGRDYNTIMGYDRDYLQRFEAIKRDPYRYVLSPKEERRCYHRVKRFIFVFGLPSLYLYKHFRYHKELARVRNLKFSSIQLLEAVPRLVLAVIILYPFSSAFFIDYGKLKENDIAKYELKKFDPEWFSYDDYKYASHNQPAYKSNDSTWGRLYLRRLPFTYHQMAGWVERRRENNNDIISDVPPKYDFTPNPPLPKIKTTEQLPFLAENKYS